MYIFDSPANECWVSVSFKCAHLHLGYAVNLVSRSWYYHCHWTLLGSKRINNALHTLEQKKVCITKSAYLWTSDDSCMKFSESFLHNSANDFKSISCQFQKTITVTPHCSWFQILHCHPHETPWSGSFCWERVSFHSETTEKHVLFSVSSVCDLHRQAASVRWWLSAGWWDVRAWHFGQQSCSSFQFP